MYATNLICIALSTAALVPLPAAGQQKRNPGPATGAEVRVLDEKQPAGGTVQLKLSLTEPKPISSGTKGIALDQFVFDEVFGIALWSPLGDAFGVARVQNGQLQVRSLSPLGSYGTVVDYPFLTIAAHIRNDAIAGLTFPLSLDASSSFTNLLGQTEPFVPAKPGTLTVGGSASVHNVLPGGGIWPTGSLIRIVGSGFDPAARVRTKFKTRSMQVVSPTEIQLILGETVEMDAQKLTVTNPNRDTVDYYTYLRGVPQGASLVPAIASARPIFPRLKFQRIATSQQPIGIRGTVVTALALQNSSPETAQIDLTAWTPAGGVSAKAHLTLAFGQEMTRELDEYFGARLAPGTIVRITANVPVQAVTFTADTSSGALQPLISLPF